ncbi:MAG: hypothetical protein PSX37_08810 [bacterium]|nr:hypothetical protein [bacterium]
MNLRKYGLSLTVILMAFVAFTVLGVCQLHAGGSPSGLFVTGAAVTSLTWRLITRRPPGGDGQRRG